MIKEQEFHQLKPPQEPDIHAEEGLGHQKLGQEMIGLVKYFLLCCTDFKMSLLSSDFVFETGVIARPIADPEVVSVSMPGPVISFSVDHKILSMVILIFRLI